MSQMQHYVPVVIVIFILAGCVKIKRVSIIVTIVNDREKQEEQIQAEIDRNLVTIQTLDEKMGKTPRPSDIKKLIVGEAKSAKPVIRTIPFLGSL